MRYVECTLSENEILFICECMRIRKSDLEYNKIELKGEGKSTYSCDYAIRYICNLHEYFMNKL